MRTRSQTDLSVSKQRLAATIANLQQTAAPGSNLKQQVCIPAQFGRIQRNPAPRLNFSLVMDRRDLHVGWNRSSVSTQLNRELRTQVSDTSNSASSLYTIINKQYHFMTSSNRFPVPVRSAVKLSFTNWHCLHGNCFMTVSEQWNQKSARTNH